MEDKVKPRKWIETIPGMWMCGNCGESVNVFMIKCPKCGKEIDWDGRESTAYRMNDENQDVKYGEKPLTKKIDPKKQVPPPNKKRKGN